MADADRKAYQKAWRKANVEKVKAYQKAYREANLEKAKAYRAAHYRANTDTYKQKAKEWAQANPDRRYEITSKWRDEHPDVYVAAAQRGWQRHRDLRLIAGKRYQDQNAERMRELRKAWRERFPEATAHHVGLRRSRKLQATPAWADLDAIKAIYRQANRVSRETGIPHQVDHFYPLKSDVVCGLHNEFNLRVIPASVNHAKKNRVIAE